MTRKDRYKKQRQKEESLEDERDAAADGAPKRKSASRDMSVYRFDRFDVTFLSMRYPFDPVLPEELQARIVAIAEKCFESSPGPMLDEIDELIREAPNTSVLRNYRVMALGALGRIDEAFEATRETCELFPEYTLGFSNLAALCVQDSRPSDIPERFRAAADIAALAPSRRKFHVTELVTFEVAKGLVACADRDFEQARAHLALAEKFLPDMPLVAHLRRWIACRGRPGLGLGLLRRFREIIFS